MNLIVPVDLQALRVSPNDAAMITPQSSLFAGPTTSFDELPWRDGDYTDHAGRVSRANIGANVVNPLGGGVVEQLEAGVHLHWALPDGLTHATQRPDGSLAFPAVPNRWLVTRVLRRADRPTTPTARQWVVESDRLMTEADYLTYYERTRRTAVAIPVGWSLRPDADPQGGPVYLPPSRRMGQVFPLETWQAAATPPGASPDQVLHLDELGRPSSPFGRDEAPGPLTAVGSTGPAFAAYYPDCRSVFGFHDLLDDDGVDLADAAFEVSYVVIGWHSRASHDPLRSATFATALAAASTANAIAPESDRRDAGRLAAETVRATYGWRYDPAAGTPDRTLYSAQLTGLGWDTTAGRPAGDREHPQCYLTPPADDPSVRLAVGSSVSGALAALLRQGWAGRAAPSGGGGATDVDPRIEADLEFLLDALQLGLLHRTGESGSLPQLELDLHQAGFGSLPGGRWWTVRPSGTDGGTGPERFDPPEPVFPADGADLAGRLAALNDRQARLDGVLAAVDSVRRQLYSDWHHYITVLGSAADDETNALTDDLTAYLSAQVLDLREHLEAAFGIAEAPGRATANLPRFYSGPDDHLVLRDGRYTSPSPPETLAGALAAAANDVLDVLDRPGYATFELARVERARFWEPNEPVVVASGESLRPAQRNGTARELPCRLSGQLLHTLDATAPGAASGTLRGADVAAALPLATPEPGPASEGADTGPLLDDVRALLEEACLLDTTLAPLLTGRLDPSGTLSADDLAAALGELAAHLVEVWRAGQPDVPPSVVQDPAVTTGPVGVTLHGRAPQGIGVTMPGGGDRADPYLPLYLVWEAAYRPYVKGGTGDRYDPAFVDDGFTLPVDGVDLAVAGQAPATPAGAVTLHGSIPLSARATEPLIGQIREHLTAEPDENPQLRSLLDDLRGAPLLSQGLSGVNPALLSRSREMQLSVFDPFFDTEPPATALSNDPSTVNYANVLTHFVAWAVAGATDQAPRDNAAFSPLRAGELTITRAAVVDAFGRRRPVLDVAAAADAGKVTVAAQLRSPAGSPAGIGLPPRLVQPARLLFEWVSGNDARLVTNAHPSTSPVTGWVVSNHLDNSLMLFTPDGRPAGSLGVFGAQRSVAWESPPGQEARSMGADLGAPELAHLYKFATFVIARDAAFFDALGAAIEDAHTYILPADGRGEPPRAALMGRPLALVRAELRLELAGLPAFDPGRTAVREAMAANGRNPYDWTLRDDAGVRDVRFPVRLGDRDHLSDGLVAYLLDGPGPYDTIYAPAAPDTGGTALRRPGPDTVSLTPQPSLAPPASTPRNAADRVAALRDTTGRVTGLGVTLLMDPRAAVHATTGVLPVKAIDLPADVYAGALRSIEVALVTRPVLRGPRGIELPVPDEPGFGWHWTTAVRRDGRTGPQDEDVPVPVTGDRAHFGSGPLVVEDGWLRLVPQPPPPPSAGEGAGS